MHRGRVRGLDQRHRGAARAGCGRAWIRRGGGSGWVVYRPAVDPSVNPDDPTAGGATNQRPAGSGCWSSVTGNRRSRCRSLKVWARTEAATSNCWTTSSARPARPIRWDAGPGIATGFAVSRSVSPRTSRWSQVSRCGCRSSAFRWTVRTPSTTPRPRRPAARWRRSPPAPRRTRTTDYRNPSQLNPASSPHPPQRRGCLSHTRGFASATPSATAEGVWVAKPPSCGAKRRTNGEADPVCAFRRHGSPSTSGE